MHSIPWRIAHTAGRCNLVDSDTDPMVHMTDQPPRGHHIDSLRRRGTLAI